MPTIIEIDIDPERKFSNGSDWDNSIDWDDASDGSDGGYTLHDNYIVPDAMKEIIKLRIDNYNKDQRIKELKYIINVINLKRGVKLAKDEWNKRNISINERLAKN